MGNSLTHLMLLTALVKFQPKGHREPRTEVGSFSPTKQLVGFEPDTFQFLSHRLNPLGHSPGLLLPLNIYLFETISYILCISSMPPSISDTSINSECVSVKFLEQLYKIHTI